MIYWLTANLILIIHLGFIVYVVIGGFLLTRWKWSILLHLPATVWAALLEFNGWLCPLTPLENYLISRGQEFGYNGGAVLSFLLSILYPDSLTRQTQILLGLTVVIVNGVAYTLFFRHLHRRKGHN